MTSCIWAFAVEDDTDRPSTRGVALRPVVDHRSTADHRLEAVDEQLLALLVQDGRASITLLAQKVGLSVSATAARVHRLCDHGVITGFHASLDPAMLGGVLSATVRVRLSTSGRCAAFEEWLEGRPEITEVFRCTGNFDYELRVTCRDARRIHAVISAIRHAGGAAETETTLLSGRVGV